MSVIPVIYACDDAFVPYLGVSLQSLIQNASPNFRYRVHILHHGISEEKQIAIFSLQRENVEIRFDDVSAYLQTVADQLPLRDYYSNTTYYRFFFAEMFSEYEKAVYIDGDTVVQCDIAELYQTELGEAYLGACHEQAVLQIEEFGRYVEAVLGVSRHQYFNAGVLLLNCEKMRAVRVLEKFLSLLSTYRFAVAQDQDYLNLICKDHVSFLDLRWNTQVFCEIPYEMNQAKILHYNMMTKPWHYADCRFGQPFWHYAAQTPFYAEIQTALANYTDADRARDVRTGEALIALAVEETNRPDNYLNQLNAESRAKDRVEITQKIEQYERQGRFAEDVEEDPPAKPLLPEEIDYLHRGPLQRIKTKLAYQMAHRFVYRLLREKKMIVNEIRGLEHLANLQSGAVLTCNHFHAFDSFAIQMAYEAADPKNRTLYRVIREGNYTSFSGFYGFLMRHCNTLPLSSNFKTMQKMIRATGQLLREGNLVLVYPEQSMWWNYRKPKPLQSGAFVFAAKNDVPVLPCFITMRDSDVLGEDGYFVQEYTVHIAPPIVAPKELSYRERQEYLRAENERIWREIYEREYQMPLVYATK